MKNYFKAPKVKKTSLHKGKKSAAYVMPEEALMDLGPHTSLVESKVARELNRRREEWQSQVANAGGRSRSGGMVLDFLLPGRNLVLRIQGSYWHGTPGSKWKDDAQSVLLRAQGYRIADLWEYEINENVRAAVARALGEWV